MTARRTSKKNAFSSTISYVAFGVVLAAGSYWLYNTYWKRDKAVLKTEATTVSVTTEQPAQQPKVLSRDQILQTLDDIIEIQGRVVEVMNTAMDKIIAGELVGVKAVYEFMVQNSPHDPLASRGLTMGEFDQILETYVNDPQINERIVLMVNGPCGANSAEIREQAKELTIENITAINKQMLAKLQEVAAEMILLEKVMSANSETGLAYSSRIANYAVQALVGAFTKKEIGFSPDAIEIALVANQKALGGNEEFIQTHVKIQQVLESLGPL